MTDPPLCLVLSTGRCGSTVLSDVIADHPATLSISELFSVIPEHDLVERELSGPEFWALLSRRNTVDLMMLRCGIRVDELRYPVDAPRPGASQFAWASGLPPPPIAQVTLPYLTDRPDDLFRRLGRYTVGQPRRPLSEHFRWLFRILAGDRRPRLVVERSGGSLAYTRKLFTLFPGARVVHLYRDGRECALSMSRHARYKMAMVRAQMAARLGYDPYGPQTPHGDTPVAVLDPALRGLLPEYVTRTAYDSYQIPLTKYGTAWAKMIIDGVDALRDHPDVLAIDYRDLVAKPCQVIGDVLDFLGLDREAEREQRMAARLGSPRGFRSAVDDQQWQELTQACRSGMNRLYGRGRWN